MCVLYVKGLLAQTGTVTPQDLERIRLLADIRQNPDSVVKGKGK